MSTVCLAVRYGWTNLEVVFSFVLTPKKFTRESGAETRRDTECGWECALCLMDCTRLYCRHWPAIKLSQYTWDLSDMEMVQGRQQRDSPKEDVRKFSVSSVRGQPDLAVHVLIAKKPSLSLCQIGQVASCGRLGVYNGPVVTHQYSSTEGHQQNGRNPLRSGLMAPTGIGCWTVAHLILDWGWHL